KRTSKADERRNPLGRRGTEVEEGAGRGRDGRLGRKAKSAIFAPRRAADQPKASACGKAATPERSRTRTRKGALETGVSSAQWGLVATPAPIFVYAGSASGLHRQCLADRPVKPKRGNDV